MKSAQSPCWMGSVNSIKFREWIMSLLLSEGHIHSKYHPLKKEMAKSHKCQTVQQKSPPTGQWALHSPTCRRFNSWFIMWLNTLCVCVCVRACVCACKADDWYKHEWGSFDLTSQCLVCSIIPQGAIFCCSDVFNRQSCCATVTVVRADCTQTCMENGSQVCQAFNKLGLAGFPFGFRTHELWLWVYFTANAASSKTLFFLLEHLWN